MIQLRPVAITDLAQRYARDMGDNKVRHYRVSHMAMLINKFTGKSAEDVVRDFVKENENEDVEFVGKQIPDDLFITQDFSALAAHNVGGFEIVDVTGIVLGRDRKVRLALTKRKAHSMIEQRNHYNSIFGALRDRLVVQYNKYVVPNVNKLLYTIQGYDFEHYQPMARQLKTKELSYERVLDLCHFVSVAFHQDEANEALESIRNDLRLLQKQGLIRGNLSMPSIMTLADTVGVGPQTYVLFCFPIIDSKRLLKLTKKTPLELPRLPLSLVGVKNETHEGAVNWLNGKNPESRYEIETVDVFEAQSDKNNQKVLEVYESTKDFVNEHAKQVQENIERFEKLPMAAGQTDRTRDQIEFLDKETGEIFSGLDELQVRISKKS